MLRLSGNWIYAEDRLQKGMFALSASCKSIYEDEKQGITRWHIENVEAEQNLLEKAYQLIKSGEILL